MSAAKGLLMLLGKRGSKGGDTEEESESEDEKGDEESLGQALLDAVKGGDATAVYEAVCAIYENED